MLCNFTAGVQVASFLNLHTGTDRNLGPPRKKRAGGLDDYRQSRTGSSNNNSPIALNHDMDYDAAIESGSWHDRYPGEQRIQLDLSRMVSLYDTALAPSLVSCRQNVERYFHRLEGIAENEIRAVVSKIEDAVRTPHGAGSGVDWTVLVQAIVDRYAQRLEFVRYHLNQTDVLPFSTAKRIQKQLMLMTMPYNVQVAKPEVDSLQWAQPVYKLCATTHTKFIRSVPALTYAENLILASIEETNREICRVIVQMWAKGVSAGLDIVLDAPGTPEIDLKDLLEDWSTSVTNLMAWLDWSYWVKCRPECDYEVR